MTSTRKSYGNRKLFTFPEDYTLRSPKQKNLNNLKKNEENNKLLKYIDDNIIGKNNAFLGPFGRRKVLYCDYAASGRSLQFIEEYILKEVLPNYGNTHSVTNITSLQSSNFRNEAREIIKNATNASDVDAVIFTGHGCSDALQKLINALDLREPPIVFIGSSEHSDNLYLWQEIGAKMIRIAETKEGFLDLNDLENQLKLYENCNRQMIGCFSIASNVTGILIDDVACTILLHQYQALAFWDYNIGAPYINIDMNPFVPGVEEKSAYKDAIYFSGHKFIGGIQTPGILIAKKIIFKHLNLCNSFFSSQEHNKSFEMQEEGCCAAVVESIRAGLVIQLKGAVTVSNIMQRQEKINKQVLQHFRTIPELILLGNTSPNLKRLSVFSFMVRHPRGTFLHHNFVCAILNDVFGIQARSGCPCSGVYAKELLGIDHCLAEQYENFLNDKNNIENSYIEFLKPGFTRISLPYFINDSEFNFIMEAIKMVATEGWKLLPQYIADLETGEWRHYTNTICKDRKWLTSIRYIDGKMTMNERRISGPGSFPQNFTECLQTARNLFNRARKTANKNPSYTDQGIKFNNEGEKLRWFMLQQEAQNLLTCNAQNVKQKIPFDPIKYLKTTTTTTTPSPRHFSLPSIDNRKIFTSSVPYFLQDVNGLYYPQTATAANINFALGESVNSDNHFQYARERCFSLGTPILSPKTSLKQFRQRNLSYSSQYNDDNNISPTSSLDYINKSSSPDINTYVTEMTKEIATNIKSELRQVISKVENALEYCDNDNKNCDSISANDVAEYIEKVSIEMANEVKSEIRDVVSAVDVFITPDQERTCSRSSSCGESAEINIIKTDYYINSDEEKQLPSTSICSQDSGINLSFNDNDNNMELYKNNNLFKDIVKLSTLQKNWYPLPKNVWQLTIEAIQEYKMIKNGDRILVCFSGGKDSITLLHALIQYQNYIQTKGLLFNLGAVTIDRDCSSFIPHNVHYIIDENFQQETKDNIENFSSKTLRNCLYELAKKHNYNVLAIGQHLDDLCEHFLLSTFHNGKLKAIRAHYLVKKHKLRIIRPFIYVRDKHTRQFVNNHNLPININNNLTKERQRIRQILTQQEILFPKLFTSLRSALQPLFSFKETNCNSDSESETDEEQLS